MRFLAINFLFLNNWTIHQLQFINADSIHLGLVWMCWPSPTLMDMQSNGQIRGWM